MDHFRPPQIDSIGVTIRKKRSQTLRRPRPEPQSLPDQSSMSPTQLSDDSSKISSDETGDANSRGKMFNLNQCVSRPFPTSGSDGGLNSLDSNGVSGDGMENENKLKKVKLKVGGVTRTIQTNSNSNGALGTGSASSAKANQSSDSRQRQKLILQEHSNEHHSPAQDKKKGIPWKGFSKGDFGIRKEDKGGMLAKNAFEKQGEKSDPVRKSRRMPKKRVLDEEFDEDDQDDEIRYLEKLKTAKIAGYKDTRTDSARKQRKDGKSENMEGTEKSSRDFKKSKPKDVDYEEEELLSDGEPEGKTKKKQKKDLSDLPPENKRELTLTTRQRALLSKDASSESGASQIEFPNGLPPAPPRKQKEELSEMEQQLKKAEIALRRKMQNEKAARESEAEAIRKILGQDSSRKKREDKVKKRQEELALEKAANAQMLASSTIRWVMGPTGTTVIFPQDMGFPKIFESKLCSYPPPREKCAGPSCTNPYKYRDSKSKLPLCSLQCYKAIHEKTHVEKAC
ncbi:calponin homology domain-containing DDB_G0272472-like [Olea europaea subsp. europaea]|uniref:Calponin homology domain-containing DDB_G0272472-like n=1 Tax=Olea europaea subsp. europaea TaxID=158383 RepID=A0A8S0QMZ2_OLEEU|nr:calponin homology domain-containing DDB_G0272472-like [Olea europaea subsp. europaea]